MVFLTKMRCIRALTVSIFTLLSLSEGSRILIASPYGTKSHQNVYIPLAKELVRRGHQVTIITNYVNDELNKLENVKQIWIETLVVDPALYPNPFSKPTDIFEKWKIFRDNFQAILSYSDRIRDGTYNNPLVQKMMKTEHFDLVMISEICGPACFPFGWHFKAPTIVVQPMSLHVGRATMFGDEEHFSYVPFFLSKFTNQMSLKERTNNLIMSKLFHLLTHDLPITAAHSRFTQLLNPDCPPFEELEKNFSLVFTNSHPVFNYPRVLPPQVIEVGGIHCRPAKPLPENLEKFVSESDAGFVVFGIGSALRMEDLPEHAIQSMMKAFSRLPQRVIWQWKGKVPADLPKNILTVPWLPQQDLLGNSVKQTNKLYCHCSCFVYLL